MYSKERYMKNNPFWSLHEHGFGPFKLPTRGLLRKGQDHSPPSFALRSPAFWFSISFGISIQSGKQHDSHEDEGFIIDLMCKLDKLQ